MPPGLGRGKEVWEFRLELRKCCVLALLGWDTHLFWALWKELRLPSVGFAFHEAKASCFRTTASPQPSVNQGREEGYYNWRREGINLCMRESKFLWKNSQDELMSEEVEMGDQSRSLMVAWRPCQSAWVKCQTRRHWGGSLITAREILLKRFLK